MVLGNLAKGFLCILTLCQYGIYTGPINYATGKVIQTPDTRGPFYWHGLILTQTWISNYLHHGVWDEITYPFPNFNGATDEVWE